MSTLRPIASAVLGACLLQACGAPRQQDMLLQPALQVRHAGNQAAASYYQLGRYHQQNGDLELALMAFTYSIARDGAQLDARSAAAAIHAQQGRLDQAKAMLLAVVADYPRAALPYNNLGYVYYLQGDYAAAAATLRKALALDGGNDRARNNLRLAEQAQRQPAYAAPMPSVAATPAPAPAVAPQAAAAPAGAMEIVELGPNVFELKRRAMPAGVAAADALPARLEIANGNGVAGMAKRIKQVLGRQGIPVSRMTNARPYRQAATTIEYRLGHQQHAEQLRAALHEPALLLAAANLPPQSDVRLVLGRDAVLRLAAIDAAGERLAVAALPGMALKFPQ